MKKKSVLNWKLRFALCAALVLLLAVGFESYRNIRNQTGAEVWVEHTQDVLATLADVVSDVTEAESAQRGYFITGDTAFLREYETSASATNGKLARVRQLTVDNASQQRRLDALDPLVARRLRLLTQLIDLRGNTNPSVVALQISKASESREIQARVCDLLAEIIGAERSLLQSRLTQARATTRLVTLAILVSTSLAFAFLGAFIYLLQHEIAQRAWAEESEERILVTAAIRNISVRKDAEKHLAQMEGRYRGLLEAAPDAMVVVNAVGEIVLLNLQAERQFGYRRDELVGQKVKNIIPEGFAERLIADDLRTAADALTQQIGTGIELSARRKDGSDFPIEIMLSPLESTEGILVTAAIRDITERKKSELHLVKTVGELKRSNDELQQFAYVASHDLQEPLRMVASYTQLLAKRYKGRLDSEADEFIAFAVDGSNRMQGLIQDLLAYSRAGTNGKVLHEISSEKALNEALSNLRATIQESSAVVTNDPLPAIRTDDTQLTQVFQNLVGNAIKYRSAEVPRVHVSATKNGGKEWIFSVRDNGLGIDPQYFDKIFVLFQRLHGRTEFKGTGIGLAICKKILERLGGRIWVESQPEKGSTFHFTLPEREGR
jgi:PAS domain S-box-containing protein